MWCGEGEGDGEGIEVELEIGERENVLTIKGSLRRVHALKIFF